MSYTALYRKWRPSAFEDVKGQDHIVQTLQNQITKNRVGHAYLFCGTRGTGKTSIAKIFAKAVNCKAPIHGSPCNECDTCKAIGSGSSMNVIEIDAASNNGVDNIREIRDEVQYSPTEGKYRVYIIDEVHMLSSGAFNALLKTLEEPPSYVIFVLATTEAHKIPITVLSRCQRYDFKRISIDTIVEHLNTLTKAEGIEKEDKALRYVAKVADGSLRDALSLLDQCIAFYFGEVISYENVLEVLGAVDTSVFGELLRGILGNQILECIKLLETMVMQGRDLTQFVIDFTWYMRNLLLIKSTSDTGEMLDMSVENQKLLVEESKMLEESTLIRFIRIFSELSNQMRYAAQKRVLLEVAVIKLSRPEMETNLESVLQRLGNIEKQLEAGTWQTASVPQSQVKDVVKQAKDTPVQQVALPKAQLEDMTLIRDNWNTIIRELGTSIYPSFKNTVVEPSGEGRLSIVFQDSNNFGIGSRSTTLQEIKDFIAKNYQKEIEFSARLKGNSEVVNTVYVSEEDLKNSIQMDIIIEENE